MYSIFWLISPSTKTTISCLLLQGSGGDFSFGTGVDSKKNTVASLAMLVEFDDDGD
jgi:hypothetical protein